MTTVFKKWINQLLKRHKAVTLLLCLLYLLSLVPIGLFFKVDTSLKTWFLENDPDYAEYLAFQDEYGSDELVTVMVDFERSVFDSSLLFQLKSAEKELSELPFVEKVLGLTTAVYYRSWVAGLKAVPVIGDIGDSPKEIKNKLNKTPTGARQFLPKGERYVMIYIFLDKVDELEKDRGELTGSLRNVLAKHLKKYHIGGMAIINEVVNQMVMEESAYFSIYTTFFIFLILWLYFQKMGYVLTIMAAVTFPVTFLFGVFFLTGHQLNTIAMVIPTILMVYAVADGVHIINNYLHQFQENKNGNKKAIISASLLYSLKPCFYTSLTTAASYLAFSTSSLKVLRETGIFAALGIILAFLFAFIVIGCGLMWIKNTDINTDKKAVISFLKNSWFVFIDKYKTPVIIGAFGIILFSVPMINKVIVGDNFMEYMKDDSRVKTDIYAIEEINGGFLPFEFVIKSTDTVSVLNRSKQKLINDFQKRLVSDSLLQSPFSLMDLIKKAKNNEPENILLRIKLDDEKELKKILIKNRSEPENELTAIMNTDLTTIRMTGKSKIYGSHEYRDKITAIKNSFRDLNNNDIGLELRPQGFLPLYVKMIDFITSSQVSSFLLAFIFAGVFLLVCFKNIKIVLLSILPNLIPIAVTIIFMSVFRWRLDTATVMIAAIILGIAVDDTIHFLNAYLLKRKNGETVEAAVRYAMNVAGKAIRLTSLALIVGFMIIGLSAIKNLQHFGILSALAVFMALVADLIVLPALLLKFDK